MTTERISAERESEPPFDKAVAEKAHADSGMIKPERPRAPNEPIAESDPKALVKKEPMKWEDSGVPRDIVGYARAFALSPEIAVRDVPTAIAKMVIGRGLGITDFESIQYIHVWESGGKQSMQLGYPIYAALINRSPKYQYRVEETTGEKCTIAFYQLGPGGSATKIGVSEFTIEQAKSAGLIRPGSAWASWPDTMLFARALTRGAKMFCADIFMGVALGEVEEPYIEAEARTVTGDDVSPWAAFWAYAKQSGMDKPSVHAVFGVGPEEGALGTRAKQIAELNSVSEGAIVAIMRVQLEDSVRQTNRDAGAPEPETPDNIE